MLLGLTLCVARVNEVRALKWDYKCDVARMLKDPTNLHLVLRFWNQVLTCASVIFRLLARAARSALARYFCRWKRFSSSQIWTLEKDVRGFFRLGGVRFWYGCPIRRVTANGTSAAAGKRRRHRDTGEWRTRFYTKTKQINSPFHSVWKSKIKYHRYLPCGTTCPCWDCGGHMWNKCECDISTGNKM